MPTDWTIDKRELQFCYVLGHAHGRRSMPVAYDLHESEETAPRRTVRQLTRAKYNNDVTKPLRDTIRVRCTGLQPQRQPHRRQPTASGPGHRTGHHHRRPTQALLARPAPDDDGYDIYVKKVDGESRTRTTLIKDVLEDVSDAEDVEELEDLGTDFLQAATDVRYFGATLSFETSENEADEAFREGLNNALPNHYQGPVQFLPSKSLNEVEENEEYDS